MFQYNHVKDIVFSIVEQNFLLEKIRRLMRIGAIDKVEFIRAQFISNHFLIPKPNGSFRFILNLKKFNEFVSDFKICPF